MQADYQPDQYINNEGYYCLYINFRSEQSQTNCYQHIHDITITLSEDDSKSLMMTETEMRTWSTDNAFAMCVNANSVDDTSRFACILENITINNYLGRALRVYGCDVKNVTIRGGARFVYCNAKITSLSSWFPGGFLDTMRSNIYLEDVQANKANTTYPFTDQLVMIDSRNDYSKVVANTTNSRMYSNDLYNDDTYDNEKYNVITLNEVTAGHFRQISNNFLCDTSSVYRTGGSPASLKIFNNTRSVPTTPMRLGFYPYKGFPITPISTGEQTLSIYVASKGFTDIQEMLTSTRFYATIEDADGSKEILSSDDIISSWNVDAVSVWNNDTDLTQYRIDIKINVPDLQDIYVDFECQFYSVLGYIYIDPVIVLT